MTVTVDADLHVPHPRAARSTTADHDHSEVEPCHQQLSRPDAIARERGQILVLFAGGIVALLIIAAARVRRRHDARRASRRAECRRRGRAGGRSLRGHRSGRGRGGGPANRESQRLRRRRPQPDRHHPHSADPRPVCRASRLHRGPDRRHEVVDLRRDHRAVGVACRRHGRRHEPSGPDLPVLDAGAEPDRVQGDPGLRRRRLVQAFANIQSNSNGSDCGSAPIGFSRTGGSTIDVIADDATCRVVGEIQDQGSGPPMTCNKAEDSFALPDPLRNLAAPPKPALARSDEVRRNRDPARDPEELSGRDTGAQRADPRPLQDPGQRWPISPCRGSSIPGCIRAAST